jgi:hypothetical protein
VISLGYGLNGPLVAVSLLSLALNLLLTGAFILIVKALLRRHEASREPVDDGRMYHAEFVEEPVASGAPHVSSACDDFVP